MRTAALVLILLVAISLGLLALSGGEALEPVYVGGGLPPGEPDIGGIVLQPPLPVGDPTVELPLDPVVGADVVLMCAGVEVGHTRTGADGYFRFEKAQTGQYEVRVIPPPDSGLQPAERQFRHQEGRRTFLTIVLHRQE